MTDLDPLLVAVADLITAAAVLIAVLLWVTTRSWNPTMPVFLELLLAAGLLRLGATDTWRAIGGAAMIVLIRALVKSAGGRASSAGHQGRRHAEHRRADDHVEHLP